MKALALAGTPEWIALVKRDIFQLATKLGIQPHRSVSTDFNVYKEYIDLLWSCPST